MTEHHRVLVIDDNEAIHSDFHKVIGIRNIESSEMDLAAQRLFDDEPATNVAARSYEIDSAYQGQEGLAMVRRACDEARRYALAFVDVRMPPGWNGIETVQYLWKVDPDLQVVLCTAYSDYSWNEMVLRLGETDRLLVIKKPFDNIEVRQIACALTTKWQLAQQVQRHLVDLATTVEARTIDLAKANRMLRSEIAEHKKAADELKEAEARSRGILETVADGIISIDESGVIRSFNRAAEEIFGYHGREALGQSLSNLISLPADDPYIAMLRQSHANAKKSFFGERREVQGRRKEGEVFPLEIALSEGCSTEHRWFTGIFRDVTRQRQLESQLLQSQKMEAIGHLAAGVAHEINTPIQYVGDNLSFMQDAFDQMNRLCVTCEALLDDAIAGRLTDPQVVAADAMIHSSGVAYLRSEIPQALQHSRDGITQVAKIVSAMKEFSHSGAEKKELADLNRALHSAVTIASNEWKYVADLVTDLDPQLPLVPCFSAELKQVFLNLIVNAAHAIGDAVKNRTGQKGIISIRTHREDDVVVIQIADTGTGIKEDVRSKVFNPFFTTKEVGRGTGQGLAIAHAVVKDKHGGTITFESETGVGTTFTVKLPLATLACAVG